MRRIAELFEILGGARPLPPRLAASRLLSLAFGAYWALLLLVIVAFAGRTAKFVYVDF
jgi:hypothetical protein